MPARTYVRMRSPAEVATVVGLLAEGHSDQAVARLTGIPRSTVRDWRLGRRPRRDAAGTQVRACPVCRPGSQTLDERRYAYLLGLYLGDGHVSRHPRTSALRIFLDARYPGIVDECVQSLRAVRPENRVWVGRSRACRCNVVMTYSNHWPRLLPQMGSGKKHERPIRLEPWQSEIVARARQAFVRGLIHSDGCRVVASDRGVSSVRYHFSTKSDDIKRLSARAWRRSACSGLGPARGRLRCTARLRQRSSTSSSGPSGDRATCARKALLRVL